MKFKIESRSTNSLARACKIITDHGEIPTPIFIPVGTYGTVKTLTPKELDECNAKIILGNTYHLYLRPGTEIIKKAGGLHKFISWDKPILTDSGGFQVFSLSHLGKVTDKEVTFRSHIDGSQHIFTPEKSIQIQRVLGSDIIMAFDECTPYPYEYERAKLSLKRTHEWEKRSLEEFHRTACPYGHRQYIFGIIQGSVYEDLRYQSLEELKKLDFDGYAVGGLAVGEPKEVMFSLLSRIAPCMPEEKPRYFMGIGKPEDIVKVIDSGIDMFDCVLPTRNARNGTLYTWRGRIVLKQARYKDDFSPPDENCSCYTCRNFSRAFLRHLFMLGDMTGLKLNTLHNIHFFLELTSSARKAIVEGYFEQWKKDFFENYPVEEDHYAENQKRREERRRKHLRETS